MSPDESRALGLFVRQHQDRRVAVIDGGWAALTPDEAEWAEAAFADHWGRPVEHDERLPSPVVERVEPSGAREFIDPDIWAEMRHSPPPPDQPDSPAS